MQNIKITKAMTELQQRIEKEAREKYPIYTDEEIDSTQYEMPRAKKLKRNVYHSLTDVSSAGHFHEASTILSIIDKHLNS